MFTSTIESIQADRPDAYHHIYWIGGSPCSGKSTISRLLAERHNSYLYSADEHFQDHVSQADPDQKPHLALLRSIIWDDVFMRPPDVLVEEVFKIYRQEWELILNDLADLPSDRPIIAEGNPFIPECVQTVLDHPDRAVWLVSSTDFQRQHYPSRGEWVQGVLSECSDPERAFRNWMDRDARFGRQVAEQVEQAGLNLIIIDGSQSIDQAVRAVENYLFGKPHQ
jgi:hypothetical protein